MAELVYHYRRKARVVGGSEGICVVDAASAIFFGIGKYDYVFVRQSVKGIVQAENIFSSQVSGGVESAEMG